MFYIFLDRNKAVWDLSYTAFNFQSFLHLFGSIPFRFVSFLLVLIKLIGTRSKAFGRCYTAFLSFDYQSKLNYKT